MTARRRRRGSRSTLFGTFLRVLVLCVVAGFALVQCAGAAPRTAQVPRGPSRGEGGPSAPAAPRATGARGSLATIAGSVHVPLGVPQDRDPADDHFLDEQSFVLSYNPSKRVPNWVAWRLDRSYLGDVHRGDDFRPDLSLPARFYRVNEHDYLHSGYDRGHMCPSADRTDSRADNARTFLFTNMQPQLHELNAGPWERLEVYARKRAQRGQVLYIVAGGVFGAPFATIGNGVAVPKANYKIMVALNEGERPSDVSAQTEVLAVMMPNEHGVGAHDWSEYLTTVDAVEEATGYDFLSAVPEAVQRVIEGRVGRL